MRVLRGWSERSLALATVLLTPWPLFRGAPNEVIQGAKEDGDEEVLDDTGTALEVSGGAGSVEGYRSVALTIDGNHLAEQGVHPLSLMSEGHW